MLLPVSFLLSFTSHFSNLTPPKDVAPMYGSLCLSQSCRILSSSCRINLRMCVPFFQRPLWSCAAPRVYRLLFAKPPQYYSSCSVVCGSYTADFRLSNSNVLGAFAYQVSCSVSVSFNLTPKLLPCFMMGSVCPVHALYGPASVEFDPFVKPHQPCMYCCDDFCCYLFQRNVPGTAMYQVSDRALLSPCPSRFFALRARIYFERAR